MKNTAPRSRCPRDLYWIGGTGNWSDPVSWSLNSGGAGGNCMPTILDNVFFDANSFAGSNDTVYIDFAPAYCNNMNWTGATGNPVLRKIAPLFEVVISSRYIPEGSVWVSNLNLFVPGYEV